MAAPRPSSSEIEGRVRALVAAGATKSDAFDQLAEETGRTPEAIRTTYRRASAATGAAIAISIAIWLGFLPGFGALLGGVEGMVRGLITLGAIGVLLIVGALGLVLWSILPSTLRGLLGSLYVMLASLGLYVFGIALLALPILLTIYTSDSPYGLVVASTPSLFIVTVLVAAFVLDRRGRKWL